MAITLPTAPVPAVQDLTANNMLFCADYGMGKSGLMASTGYLLADPEDKLRAYPDLMRVTLTNWDDHKDFVKKVAAQPANTFQGIGLDSLNISYDHCLTWVMKNITFQGTKLTHPSENPQLCYPRITHEFITWLRDVTYLGYHVVATCHVNIAEITDRRGNKYNRWVPAFTGGSPTSTYASIPKIFSIIGFMTLEAVERPSTRYDVKAKKNVVDVRADASRIPDPKEAARDSLVIHFDSSPNWLSNNKEGGFPDIVVLTDNYHDDWPLLKKAWGTGLTHELSSEPVETDNILNNTGVSAAALAGVSK
jgi:hypothetical protein